MGLIVVIYMVVEPNVGSEVTKGVGKVVTRECRKAKSAELEFAFVSAFREYPGSVVPLAMFFTDMRILAQI